MLLVVLSLPYFAIIKVVCSLVLNPLAWVFDVEFSVVDWLRSK